LVVVSGVFYPAWHASVDGNPAQVYAVDRALQGVAVSAGEHHLVLRYQSAALMAGLGITILTAALVAALAILHIITQSRDGSGEVRCKAGAVPQL
jgi:uncharacterized membrane protein YfhO